MRLPRSFGVARNDLASQDDFNDEETDYNDD